MMSYHLLVQHTTSYQMNTQKESPFFLMFGRDAILPLNKLLQPQVQYLGNDENILSMQALTNIYEVVAKI